MKKIVSLIMAAVLSLAAIFVVGCNKQAEESDASVQSTASVNIPDPLPDQATAEDRGRFSYKSMTDKAYGMTMYDFCENLLGKRNDFTEDLLVGDIVNSVLEAIVASAIGVEGINVNALGYTRYSDGYWKSNASGKDVHKILNALLNYRVDGSEPLAITESDLETYGDSSLIDILGYKNNLLISKAIEGNEIVVRIINADLKTLLALFNEDTSCQAFTSLFGDLTLGYIASIAGKTVPEEYASTTISEVAASVANEINVAKEVGFNKYFADHADAICGYLVEKYGDKEVIAGLTLSEAVAALNDFSSEEAKKAFDILVGIADGYLGSIKEGLTVMSVVDALYPMISDLVIYGEYTVEDLYQALCSSDAQETYFVVLTELNRLCADEEYKTEITASVEACLREILDRVGQNYGEEVIVIDEKEYTVAEIVDFLRSLDEQKIAEMKADAERALEEYLASATIGSVISEAGFVLGETGNAALDELISTLLPMTLKTAIDGGAKTAFKEFAEKITVDELLKLLEYYANEIGCMEKVPVEAEGLKAA